MNDEKPAAVAQVTTSSSVSAATNAFFTCDIVGRETSFKKIESERNGIGSGLLADDAHVQLFVAAATPLPAGAR